MADAKTMSALGCATTWAKALDVADLIEPAPGSLARFRPRMSYLLLEEHAMDDQELAEMENLVAGIIRIEKSRKLGQAFRVLYTLWVIRGTKTCQ